MRQSSWLISWMEAWSCRLLWLAVQPDDIRVGLSKWQPKWIELISEFLFYYASCWIFFLFYIWIPSWSQFQLSVLKAFPRFCLQLIVASRSMQLKTQGSGVLSSPATQRDLPWASNLCDGASLQARIIRNGQGGFFGLQNHLLVCSLASYIQTSCNLARFTRGSLKFEVWLLLLCRMCYSERKFKSRWRELPRVHSIFREIFSTDKDPRSFWARCWC